MRRPRSLPLKLQKKLKGLQKALNIDLTKIVILNNYTDFRDIQLPDEGCSTVHVQTDDQILSGQTWDMHGSAKRFVNVIHIPKTDLAPESVVFSLIGCVGMMGINTSKNLIGVNNINTVMLRRGLFGRSC